MILNKKDQKICDKYGATDSEGKVHCFECPLRKGVGSWDFRCKANSYYDKKTREWEWDNEQTD